MQRDVDALQQLARIAVEGTATKDSLTTATRIIRRATGASEVLLVYAPDKDFLTCSDAAGGPSTELTLAALTRVQRHAAQANAPVAFNLVGQRVEDFTGALGDGQREFLAFSVPTTESAAEMCILRGTWERKARAGVLRFMESATPALTLILERFLNADRGQRLAEQLHTLANAAQVLTRSEDVKAALRELATAISASTGFEYLVNIDLYDATASRFFLRIMSEQRHTTGILAQAWEASLNPDRPDPWDVEVMTTLQPRFSPDMQNDPVYPEHVRKFYARALLRSTVDFPLLFQDEFLGTMAFVSYKPRTFPPQEVSFLQGFVAQAAMALKALQMHEELQRYAEEVKRSADEYIATTNLTGDIIARLDGHGKWTFLNDAACQFYGKPREELLGVDSRTYVHPEDLEATARSIREARAKRALTTGFINRCVTPMGIRVVEWNGYALFDEEGQYAGIQITGRDITERKQMEEERERLHAELETRAITDGLTTLYNHVHFFHRLSEEIERSKRYNRCFAVVMMDVDNFKLFNDSYGHQAGDEVLRLVAEGIRCGLRRSDLAFRYGGDEFAAILLNAGSAKAQAIVERIKTRITRKLKQIDAGATANLALSSGIARFPDDGTTADALVKVADAALYSAKWAARARGVMQRGQAIESRGSEAPQDRPLKMPSVVASSLFATLRRLGVPDGLADLNLRTMAALGTLAEIKDAYVRGHQERTSRWAATLAQEMGLSPDRVRSTKMAGLLHDLGKVGTSRHILNKPGRLTEEEFAKIKEHPPLGSIMIMSEIETLQQLVPVVRHHHERFDGKGYPDGLAGEEIPLEARIIAVVDSFDAMTHERSYRKAMSREEAMAELECCAGTQFDPAVVEAFLAVLRSHGEDVAPPAQADESIELAPVASAKPE